MCDGSSSLCEDLVGSTLFWVVIVPGNQVLCSLSSILTLGIQLVLEVGDMHVGQRRLSVFGFGSSCVRDGCPELAGQSGFEGQLVQVF